MNATRTDKQIWEALARVQGCAARLDVLAKELCGMVDVEERQGWRGEIARAWGDLNQTLGAAQIQSSSVPACHSGRWQFVAACAIGWLLAMYGAPVLRWLFILGAAR